MGQPANTRLRSGYLTAEQTRRVYDRIGRIQDLQTVYEHRAIKALLAHADFAHAHAVCELGHGTGALAERLLRDELPSSARYAGIDISPHMHEMATRRLNAYADRIELPLGNALPELPYPDAMVRSAMKKGLPGDTLRFVTGSYRRGGPLRCCTPGWISVASVSTSACSTATVRPLRSARRRPMPTGCAA